MNAFPEDYKDMFPDGVHPNDEGHEIIFEAVKEYFYQKDILK